MDKYMELVGNTPLFECERFNKINNLKSKIYCKLEFFNPSGSIKDRAVKEILNDYLEKGLINKDTVIIEATSGNTGISLSCMSRALGIRSIIVMPNNMSSERKEIIDALKSELVLTDGKYGMNGANKKARELLNKIPNSILLDQFNNSNNVLAHVKTAEEIFDNIKDIDYIVASVGSGGTVMGIAKYIKNNNINCKVVVSEIEDNPILSKGKIGEHNIQGVGANFIPSILDVDLIDRIILVSEKEVYDVANEFVEEEGILIGMSSALNLAAALKIAKIDENKKIVVIFPDNGNKYLSTSMYKKRT